MCLQCSDHTFYDASAFDFDVQAEATSCFVPKTSREASPNGVQEINAEGAIDNAAHNTSNDICQHEKQ